MRRRSAALALAACALAPAPALGQWVLDLGAGRAVHDPLASRAAVVSAAAGVRYEPGSGSRWLYLSAGAPLDGESPSWGAGGGGVRLRIAERGGVALGLRASADLWGYRAADSLGAGGGAMLAAAPVVSLARGRVRGEAYAGGLAWGERGAFETGVRPLLDAGGRVALSPAAGVEVAAEGRWLRDDARAWPYLGGGAELRSGRLSAWVFGGRWLTAGAGAARNAYGGGAGVDAGPARISLSWEQEPSSPIFRSAPRRSWSVRASRALGRPRRAPARVPALPHVAEGRVTISVPAAGHARAPSVMGDFTGWKPVVMTREGNLWTVRLPLAPGTYHYGFRSASGRWFIPASLPAVDDGMGGTSAVLVVP